jgi:hypothetical protein
MATIPYTAKVNATKPLGRPIALYQVLRDVGQGGDLVQQHIPRTRLPFSLPFGVRRLPIVITLLAEA